MCIVIDVPVVLYVFLLGFPIACFTHMCVVGLVLSSCVSVASSVWRNTFVVGMPFGAHHCSVCCLELANSLQKPRAI